MIWTLNYSHPHTRTQDVNRLKPFTTGNDHRMVRSKIKINRKRAQIDRISLKLKKAEYEEQHTMKYNNEHIDDNEKININHKRIM